MITIQSLNQDAIDLHVAQMQYMELEMFIEDIEEQLVWDQFIYFCNTGDYKNVADVD